MFNETAGIEAQELAPQAKRARPQAERREGRGLAPSPARVRGTAPGARDDAPAVRRGVPPRVQPRSRDRGRDASGEGPLWDARRALLDPGQSPAPDRRMRRANR